MMGAEEQADVHVVAEVERVERGRRERVAEPGRRHHVGVAAPLELQDVGAFDGRSDLLGDPAGRSAELQ